MVAICDDIAREAKGLERDHPSCRSFFDRILDYRSEAEKRRELHT